MKLTPKEPKGKIEHKSSKDQTDKELLRIKGVRNESDKNAKEISDQLNKQAGPQQWDIAKKSRHEMNKQPRDPKRRSKLLQQSAKTRRSPHLRDPEKLETQKKSENDKMIDMFGNGPLTPHENTNYKDRVRSGAEKRGMKDPKPNPSFFDHKRIDHLKK